MQNYNDFQPCVANINDIRTRRVLTLAFKNEEGGVLFTDVLVYLTLEYLNQIKKQQDTLFTKYNGFMVKTYYDAEFGTGISYQKVRLIYKGLEKAGLIETKKGGQDNRTCVKVDLSAIDKLLEEYKPKYDELISDYIEKQNTTKEKRKQQSKVQIETINELTDRNDYEELKEEISDRDTLLLVYCVNNYYKQFTGQNFEWTLGDLNTMLQPIRGRWYYGAELGLAIAVYKAIRDKSSLYFGQKFKLYFNMQPYRNDVPKDLVFNDLLGNI